MSETVGWTAGDLVEQLQLLPPDTQVLMEMTDKTVEEGWPSRTVALILSCEFDGERCKIRNVEDDQ